MARISGRQPLTLKDMTQMRAAGGAGYFRPQAVRIGRMPDRALDLLIKRRPAATGIKFIIGEIKRRFTTAADVDPRLKQIIVLARKRRLRAFTDNYPRLI